MQDTQGRLTGVVHFHRAVRWMSEKLQWISFVAIVALMFGTCADVIGRYLFDNPILGVFDATGLVGCVIVSFGLARTQVLRGHTSVQILISRLGQRPRAIIQSAGWLISSGLFGMLTWRSFLFANSMRRVGEYTMTVKIPTAPFAFVMAVACGLLTLVLLADFLNSLAEIKRK
ncbi:MAG: TRAP transporter small permease [Deltaproteobacteria bacterium]|nr:TRAP transporter small permease [Deltaproteobacteria bacterium]